MKNPIKILLLGLCVLPMIVVQGQNADLDTVFVKRTVGVHEFEMDTLFIPGGRSSPQVLAGTTFLPYSDKMIGLLNNGLAPISLEVIEDCDRSIDPRTFDDYPKFLNVLRDKNELTIDVSIVANCCHNFLGEAEVVGAHTLNLVYTAYGGFCACNCCFTLRYTFNTTMEEKYQILKFVTINGAKTVGQIPTKE